MFDNVLDVPRSIDIRSDLPAPQPVGSTVQLRILDEAAHQFLTAGYAETTLRKIAAGVDMKAGSIYHHFASKDELVVTNKGCHFVPHVMVAPKGGMMKQKNCSSGCLGKGSSFSPKMRVLV